MRIGDVGEVAQHRNGVPGGVFRRDGQGMVGEVGVERLIIVGVAGELGPGLALIEMHGVGFERGLRKGDQGRVQADQVQCRRTVKGYRLDRGELSWVKASDLIGLFPVHRLVGSGGAPENLFEIRPHGCDFRLGEEVSNEGDAVTAPNVNVARREPRALP